MVALSQTQVASLFLLFSNHLSSLLVKNKAATKAKFHAAGNVFCSLLSMLVLSERYYGSFRSYTGSKAYKTIGRDLISHCQ